MDKLLRVTAAVPGVYSWLSFFAGYALKDAGTSFCFVFDTSAKEVIVTEKPLSSQYSEHLHNSDCLITTDAANMSTYEGANAAQSA